MQSYVTEIKALRQGEVGVDLTRNQEEGLENKVYGVVR